jgi:hypothetical protein
MKTANGKQKNEYDRFESALRKILSVPKKPSKKKQAKLKKAKKRTP